MKKAFLGLFLTGCFAVAAVQTVHKEDSETERARLAMCDAAATKLQEAGTNQIVLMLTLNAKGQVGSFKTESPKGLKLEKVQEVATKVKAIPFAPAKKDGSPIAVQVKIAFDCALQPTSTP